jgi:hypothetical protein
MKTAPPPKRIKGETSTEAELQWKETYSAFPDS